MRNLSLWSNLVFEKGVISHAVNKRFELKPFIICLKVHKMQCSFFFLPRIFKDFYWLFIMHIKAHKYTSIWVFFLSLFSINFDEQFSPNFHRFYAYMWDMPIENIGLLQLPTVSISAFKVDILLASVLVADICLDNIIEQAPITCMPWSSSKQNAMLTDSPSLRIPSKCTS